MDFKQLPIRIERVRGRLILFIHTLDNWQIIQNSCDSALSGVIDTRDFRVHLYHYTALRSVRVRVFPTL